MIVPPSMRVPSHTTDKLSFPLLLLLKAFLTVDASQTQLSEARLTTLIRESKDFYDTIIKQPLQRA